MKLAIIGAAGLRTPLIVQAILKRQERLELDELALMDIDGERLDLIGALTAPLEESPKTKFHILRTTDPIAALRGADFVVTTFRVGGIESRAIDERVPLNHGILGQETTGPGGFALGIRSIPVIIDYVEKMKQVCPHAWLINFANPAGMLTEAVVRHTGWSRAVGICDGPASMQRVIAAFLGGKTEDISLDYFGLNHLGWIRRVMYQDLDQLPSLLERIKLAGLVPGLPFEAELVSNLGMLLNEYLYYYYYNTQAVKNILSAGVSRGEQIARLNLALFAELRQKYAAGDLSSMQTAYESYMNERGNTYMVSETGANHPQFIMETLGGETEPDEGYAGVALNLIEALRGDRPLVQISNIPNHGSIAEMEELDVVEIPALVSHDQIKGLPVGNVPDHCLGLMKEVKYYEHLTIEAAIAKSYQKALLALTIHPLVRDFTIARSILDEYRTLHKGYFPVLQ
jgi:alpha-galactosidase/6-phospho-beta-glucosidase family protein